jgi:hypothetical protein
MTAKFLRVVNEKSSRDVMIACGIRRNRGTGSLGMIK